MLSTRCLAITVAIAAPAAANAATLTTLYKFHGGKDGWSPEMPLISQNGLLYGTTIYGGANHYGMVFAVDATTGAETVLYNFTRQDQHGFGNPLTLQYDNGTVYGTTVNGGTKRSGLVFAIDMSTGTETTLHEFGKSKHADAPAYPGSLIFARGALFGTSGGGTAGYGAIFHVSPEDGRTKTIYSFTSEGSANGPYPNSLIYSGGMFYGTTQQGGTPGAGTVYSFNPDTEAASVLYTFTGSADGAYPAGGLIAKAGALYGVATTSLDYSNCGTVFKIDLATDAETTLHEFTCASHDGATPNGPLIYRNNALFGTTQAGGTNGSGTIFKLSPADGTAKILHSFPVNGPGTHPATGLIYANGAFYGTTSDRYNGYDYGRGTVFKFTP